MPEEKYQWLKKILILDFDELTRLVGIFQRLGVDRLRLTGGEPLLRKDLPVLVSQLASLGLREIGLTTNGVVLARYQKALLEAGIDRFTVSIDALDRDLFAKMAQRDELDKVLQGIHSVAHSPNLKLDSVVIKGVNENQIVPLLEFSAEVGAEVRFIEYMDVGGATHWATDKVFTQSEILGLVESAFGRVEEVEGRGSAPAQRFRLASGQTFGIIASTTKPFCGACDRARVTADGQLLTCLYSRVGRSLRTLLRSQRSDLEIAEILAQHWSLRSDRGAENRLAVEARGPLANADELQENVHLEMHTRGG